MTVDEVLTGLDNRFELLTGGFRTALPRHQTLRAMIDWSWSLLDDHERKALLQFAVFPAGLSASDAKALAADLHLGDPSVFDALVDRSLVQRNRGRFRALETVREYGIGRLSESGELHEARKAQASFVARAAAVEDRALRSDRTMDALGWFDAEEDNLAAALRFVTSAPLPELAVRLVVSCAWYWIIRDRSREAQEWFERVAPLAESVDDDEARAVALMGHFVTQISGLPEQDAGAIPDFPPELLDDLARVRVSAGGHDLLQLVAPFVEAFMDAFKTRDWINALQLADVDRFDLDPWPKALLHVARAGMAQNRGALAELGTESKTAMELFRVQGDVWGLALSEQMRSIYLAAIGQLEEAIELSDSSTEHMRDITTNWDLAQQQGLAIQLLLRVGRTDEATARVDRMLEDAASSGIARTMLQAAVSAAGVDVFIGDLVSASSHLAQAEELRSAWHGEPGQVAAMVESLHGALAIKRGDLDAAEVRFRAAAGAAVRSRDQPIIAIVAVGVGSYALARGDVATAVRAIDFSTSMIGAYDATNPEIIAIVAAADERGIGRPSTEVPERPMTMADFQGLLEA
jgi:tetratricopeptide (TPR) repeat protein